MKVTAKLGSYSSVVGQSIMLHDGVGKVVCQLAMLNVGETLETYRQSHKELCNTYGQFVVDKINCVDYTSMEVRAAAHEMARWVDCREREPKVGGTYFTGKWVGPINGLRQFRRKLLYCIIHEDVGLRWYDFRRDRLGNQRVAFPHCWLEGMPGAPPDDGR